MKRIVSLSQGSLAKGWSSGKSLFNIIFLGSDGGEDIQTLRLSLRRVIVAWLYGSAWMYLVTGAAFTRYAELLGLSEFGFGLLAAIPFIGPMMQLPASYMLERYGHRKEIFLWTCTIHRFLWIVIAALPWLVPASWQWPALVTLMLISSILAHLATPAWMSWMADLIPARIRGRYFSRRIQFGQAVGFVISLLAGLALDWQTFAPWLSEHCGISFSYPVADQARMLRNTISCMFAIAGILGMIDILIFIKVPDEKHKLHRPQFSLSDLIVKPLANRNFRLFLGYSATMTFATGYIGQFVWLYLFNEVGMSNFKANLMLVCIPILVMACTYPAWGRIVDRFGSKPALLIAGLFVVNGATAWVFVTRDHWVLGYMCAMIATMAWPGMDLAAFNLLLRMTDAGDKGRASSAVIAINSFVVAVAGVLSGIFGGAVAEFLGKNWHATVLGWPLSYHGVLFIISAFLRAASLLWLLPLKETKGAAPRDALRYMVTNAYSNLLQASDFSMRMLITMVKLTWRLPISTYRQVERLIDDDGKEP